MRIEIPTAMTRREAAVISRLCEGKRCLELGALLGFGTVTMGRVAVSVVSVDTHDGYPAHAPRPTLGRYLENLSRYGVADRVDVVVGDFRLIETAVVGSEVAMIDLTGEYGLTMEALRICSGAHVIAVHDCARSGCGGATRAVEQFAQEMGRRIRVVDTLAVMEF